MTDFRIFSGKHLFLSLVPRGIVGDSIMYIYCCSGCFFPQGNMQILIMDHGFYNFHDRSIPSFYHTILLWIIGNGELPLNPRFLLEIIESFNLKSPKLFDLNIFIFFSQIFSTMVLHSLNLSNTSSLLFDNYIQVLHDQSSIKEAQ